MDYTKVYAPVARMETIRLGIIVASSKGWSVCQLDVKFSFLNGPLEEEVYVLQPPDFEVKGRKHHMYKLRKINVFLLKHKFTKCSVEFALYVRLPKGINLIPVCLYVSRHLRLTFV